MGAVDGPLAMDSLRAESSEGGRLLPVIKRSIDLASDAEIEAYLAGAMHDGTYSAKHRTVRIAQSDLNWMQVLGDAFEAVGANRWFYREGSRDIYVVESSFVPGKGSLQNLREKAAYIRGYFDAEGGVPRSPDARFYVQFCQKDQRDLGEVKLLLESLEIRTGRMHNPSKRVDPEYWRFFLPSDSFKRFIETIGSWHPRKARILRRRIGGVV